METNVETAVYATPEEMANIWAALRIMQSETLTVDDETYSVDTITKAIAGLMGQRGGCDSLNATVTFDDDEAPVQVADPKATDAFHHAEEVHRIGVMMNQAGLTARQREVVAHYYGLNGDDSHSLQEVADILGITKKAVHTTLERAHAKMKTVGEYA